MSACPFKVGETYATVQGGKARVLHIAGTGIRYPIMAVHDEGTPNESYSSHTPSGMVEVSPSERDLMPPTVRVPLGPEDVPPGSVVRFSDLPGWMSVSATSGCGINFRNANVGSERWNWEECAASSLMISTDGGQTWQTMSKEIPANGKVEP